LDDKLSILDIKATDANGAIYDIEMQVTIFEGLVQRVVFYGCEMYAGQLIDGEIKGEIKLIRTLEGILGLELSKEEDLQKLDLESLQKLTTTLQDRARNRA
jgi:predicted transposase/invertase (TIGR01784 family)